MKFPQLQESVKRVSKEHDKMYGNCHKETRIIFKIGEGYAKMAETGNVDIYTERILWALWYRPRAGTVATISGYTGLAPGLVVQTLERLVTEKWVNVYRKPGQPALYFWYGPRDRDMIKTAEMVHHLVWDLPIDDRIV
jgi:DNA-binding MarR family transcriptional regulator